jgi:hypothetical protein
LLADSTDRPGSQCGSASDAWDAPPTGRRGRNKAPYWTMRSIGCRLNNYVILIIKVQIWFIGAHMKRTIIIAQVLLLATTSIVHADNKDASLLNLGVEHRYLHRIDMNISSQEYDEIYENNQKFILNNLRTYSENALGMIGMPEQGANLMGFALGMVFNDSRLNLNKSETLILEIKDMRESDRTLYFGVNLDW